MRIQLCLRTRLLLTHLLAIEVGIELRVQAGLLGFPGLSEILVEVRVQAVRGGLLLFLPALALAFALSFALTALTTVWAITVFAIIAAIIFLVGPAATSGPVGPAATSGPVGPAATSRPVGP